MTDTANSRLIYIATIAIAIGAMIYLVDRQADAYFLPASLATMLQSPPLFGVLGQQLPGFLHIYAFILLTVACLPPQRAYVIAACATWLLIECLFEAGQHPLLQNYFAAFVPTWFDGVPFLEVSAEYFINGSFDPLDILAVALGATAASLTVLFTRIKKHENDESQ